MIPLRTPFKLVVTTAMYFLFCPLAKERNRSQLGWWFFGMTAWWVPVYTGVFTSIFLSAGQSTGTEDFKANLGEYSYLVWVGVWIGCFTVFIARNKLKSLPPLEQLHKDSDPNNIKEDTVDDKHEKQLTNEEKLEIAAQVLRGERPQSDLKKYGISIEAPKELNAKEKEEFLKKLLEAHETDMNRTDKPDSKNDKK